MGDVCRRNGIDGHHVEPYAGGAAVALHLLFGGLVREATINDLDRSVFAFWHSVLHRTEEFCDRIMDTDATLENWDAQRRVQDAKVTAPLFELGFSTFFLNRTNRSGIIAGRMIGGRRQAGGHTIGCRFNRDGLAERIRRIGTLRDRMRVLNLDAMELVKRIRAERGEDENTLFYLDPPYYSKGPSVYPVHYSRGGHAGVAKAVQDIRGSRWIVSYDAAPEIVDLYRGCPKVEYPVSHTAYRRRESMEVLFFSKNLDTGGVPLVGIAQGGAGSSNVRWAERAGKWRPFGPASSPVRLLQVLKMRARTVARGEWYRARQPRT